MSLLFLGCAAVDDGTPVADGADLKGDRTAAPVALRSTVVVHYPTGWGHRVELRGSGGGLDWWDGREARWTENDAWVLAVDLTAAVELKPLFDDAVWSKGPNYRLEPGQTIDLWPVFFHDAGRLERRVDWRSPLLEQDRDVVIYLPPSYDENIRRRYPVVYMHDGQNLWFDRDSFGGVAWDVAGAMNRGFTDATVREAIVIGVDNTADRIWEYTPTDGGYDGGGADVYLEYLAEELKPIMDRDYRTMPGRESTGIAGSSLGGLVSVWGGASRGETFGLVAALSPSTWWDDRWILAQVRDAAWVPARVYVDSGDSGTSQDDKVNTALLADAYRARGATLKYLVQRGASHNETWWRQRLPGALAFLLGPR